MPLTIGQKREPVLRFFRGPSTPRVATTLAAHGFSQADGDEGGGCCSRRPSLKKREKEAPASPFMV
jgi:hypothetical protein